MLGKNILPPTPLRVSILENTTQIIDIKCKQAIVGADLLYFKYNGSICYIHERRCSSNNAFIALIGSTMG